nr:MAG TPA: hypothetical protein [Caudoviricetes sp.]
MTQNTAGSVAKRWGKKQNALRADALSATPRMSRQHRKSISQS